MQCSLCEISAGHLTWRVLWDWHAFVATTRNLQTLRLLHVGAISKSTVSRDYFVRHEAWLNHDWLKFRCTFLLSGRHDKRHAGSAKCDIHRSPYYKAGWIQLTLDLLRAFCTNRDGLPRKALKIRKTSWFFSPECALYTFKTRYTELVRTLNFFQYIKVIRYIRIRVE